MRFFLIPFLLSLSIFGLVLTRNVTVDHRAITIDGERKLLFAGHVHYPRATPDMWPRIFKASKAAGINAIDTYVFWNEHEEERGKFDFSGNKDLKRFLNAAQEEGLYVILRVGPYVCAEWNYGGFPAWLREIPGIDFRNDNAPFKKEMARYISFMVSYVKDYLYTNGGPIILLQVENEYGLVEKLYGNSGFQYANWAASYALSLDSSNIPWFMCVQDNVPNLINTCNGFYCDNWISGSRPYKDQVGMFTELWTGWFMAWGDVKPIRPAKDLAFATLRWIARGGTYTGHYMWFGGTNFGRSAGYGITTSYDYDAPLDEFGFPAEPKYSQLSVLQNILLKHERIITGNFVFEKIADHIEAHIYGQPDSQDSIFFLSNDGLSDEKIFFKGQSYLLPRWSVSIVKGPFSSPTVLYNSAADIATSTRLIYEEIKFSESDIKFDGKQEPVGIWNEDSARLRTIPMEQISVTRDKSDYLWYVLRNITLNDPIVKLKLESAHDHVYVFWNGEFKGASRGGLNLTFSFRNDAKASHELSIMTQTLGLSNFGPHLQNWNRGLVGKITLNSEDITEFVWLHQVGLKGEHEMLFDGSDSKNFDLKKENQTLIWYRMKFPSLNKVDEHTTAIVADLNSMGKGYAWMNGHSLGRYWNITSSMPGQPTNPYPKPDDPLEILKEEICDYSGSFNADKCRDSSLVGQPTQRYYHIPHSWLNFDGSDNVLVLFEETGGQPSQVKLSTIRDRISRWRNRRNVFNVPSSIGNYTDRSLGRQTGLTQSLSSQNLIAMSNVSPEAHLKSNLTCLSPRDRSVNVTVTGGPETNSNITKSEAVSIGISKTGAQVNPAVGNSTLEVPTAFSNGSSGHTISSTKRPSMIEQWNNLRRKSAALWNTKTSSVVSTNTQNTLMTSGPTLALPGFLMMTPDHDFQLSRILTEGGGGVIYIGLLLNTSTVLRNGGKQSCTVKIPKDIPYSQDETEKSFSQEVAIMWLFNQSKNFVKLIGYSQDPKMMIMRHYEYGNLKTAIYNKKESVQLYFTDEQWTTELIVDFTYDIARALAEIHYTGIVHNDIKPANVLIDKDESGFYALLCDFGVATVFDESLMRVKAMSKSELNGTSVSYAAPEVFVKFEKLASNNVATTMSPKTSVFTDSPDILKGADTYAFSMVIFEMISRTSPWGTNPNYEEVQGLVMKGLRPRVPEVIEKKAQLDSNLRSLIGIMHRCWAQMPLDRPLVKRVLPEIHKLKRRNRKKLLSENRSGSKVKQ